MTRRAQKDLFGEDARRDIAESRDRVLNRIIWTDGLALLVGAGLEAEKARSLLGKKVNDVGRDSVARGILSAYIGNVVAPIPYIAALKPPPASVEDEDGEVIMAAGESTVDEPFWDNDDKGPP